MVLTVCQVSAVSSGMVLVCREVLRFYRVINFADWQ